MKMTQRHYDRLAIGIAPALEKTSLQSYLDKGLTAQRWRWDLIWSWDREERMEWFEEVYTYCNDDHIDTALRKITQTR